METSNDDAIQYNIALIVIDELNTAHLEDITRHRPHADHQRAGNSLGTLFSRCISPAGLAFAAHHTILTGDPHLNTEHLTKDDALPIPNLGELLQHSHHRAALVDFLPDATVSSTQSGILDQPTGSIPKTWQAMLNGDSFDEIECEIKRQDSDIFLKTARFLANHSHCLDEKPYFLFVRSSSRLQHQFANRHSPEVPDQYPHVDFLDNADPEPDFGHSDGCDNKIRQENSDSLGLILKHVFELFELQNTVAILVGHNGANPDSESGQKDIHRIFCQEHIHVPLFLHLPTELINKYPSQDREQRVCSTTDIVPTILDCLERSGLGLPGFSLLAPAAHRCLAGAQTLALYSTGNDHERASDSVSAEFQLNYPLKRIAIASHGKTREYLYNLAYDPNERQNLYNDDHAKAKRLLEPTSFIVAVNDWDELKFNLLESPVARSTRHEWLLIDNTDNQFTSISKLYQDALRKAKNDLIFFMHQDLYLPYGWEEKIAQAIQEMSDRHLRWGVIGAVGVTQDPDGDGPIASFKGHWCDPHGYFYLRPLPHEVESLDEQWLGIRRSQGIEFDENLPGFHCYGIDLSLSARDAGYQSYAIDAFVWHKRRDARGSYILSPKDSSKIAERDSSAFREDYMRSVEYVRKKWFKYLPFRSTSWKWE